MAKSARVGPTMIQRSRSKPSEEKALYHNITGAGRSRVTRKFLGLTPAEEDDIGQKLQQHVGNQFKVRRSG